MRTRDLAAVVMLSATFAFDRDLACPARVDRVGAASIYWIHGPRDDADVLLQWCRGVGPPVYVAAPASAHGLPPALDDLVVVTWNAHLAEGRLTQLVDALRSGLATGTPVRHFVLLLQELYRRGDDLPPFAAGARSAHAIRARDPASPDVNGYATSLGLSLLYVPSMRNGPDLFEDRGNAILSTEPLSNALGIELPFERQRRVAIGAAIPVVLNGVNSTLRVVTTHLEPVSSPRSLWFFRDPRRRQVGALLDLVTASRFEDDVAWSGTILGGDFNTVQGGVDERAYRAARAWGDSLGDEDRRATHILGRLDYVFTRLPEGWSGATRRIGEKFGSDHHPVAARFTMDGRTRHASR
jgi:endonuclease/exonuclease/phosphatase family metal-dependent hydrolase